MATTPRRAKSDSAAQNTNEACSPDSAEELQVLEALQHANWNRKQAAQLLNISYGSFLAALRKYGLDRQPFGDNDE